jgi:hypothetical protein
MKTVVFGLGGYCENCDPSHDHPLNNIVEVIEGFDPIGEPAPTPSPDAQALAEALTQLPEETLNALKQALGL